MCREKYNHKLQLNTYPGLTVTQTLTQSIGEHSCEHFIWCPLLLTWFHFNPTLDK